MDTLSRREIERKGGDKKLPLTLKGQKVKLKGSKNKISPFFFLIFSALDL